MLSGNSLAGMRLLKPCSYHLLREMKASTVVKLVVCSAWIFVCDPLIESLCGVLQEEQGSEMLCVANEFEGKPPRNCLLGGLGQT